MTNHLPIPSQNRDSNPSCSIPILLVDDDIVPVMLLQRAVKALGVSNPTTVANDGEQALQILRGWVGEDFRLPPVLVVLDLNMPRMNGLEFLSEVRSDPALRHVLVFVNSSSDLGSDVSASYDFNVAGYFRKMGTSESAVEIVELLQRYVSVNVFQN